MGNGKRVDGLWWIVYRRTHREGAFLLSNCKQDKKNNSADEGPASLALSRVPL